MSKSITQDMAYRQSLMKYAENTASAVPAGSTTRVGHTSTSGNSDGMEVRHPLPASPDGHTAIKPAHRRRTEANPRYTPQESNAWHDRTLAPPEAAWIHTLSGEPVPRDAKNGAVSC